MPDVGAEWSYADRLAFEAGKIGDELHPEPDFDCNGQPIVEDDGLPIMIRVDGRIV